MMKFPTMFSPVQIGTVTVPNRFVVPPMGNNLANTDGTLSDRSLSYYQARAKGGFGLITIESTVVYREAKGGPRKPCLFSDDTVESFRRVADACHAYGAKVSIQLQHAGPEGNSALTGYPLKAASAMPASAGREIPEAVSNEEVYRIIECYGDAARRAQQAGIDMVEVHCAHGYLVSTFISQRTKRPFDAYLVFNAKTGKIGFEFPPREKKYPAKKAAAKSEDKEKASASKTARTPKTAGKGAGRSAKTAEAAPKKGKKQ